MQKFLLRSLMAIIYQNNFENDTKLVIIRRGELQFAPTRPY